MKTSRKMKSAAKTMMYYHRLRRVVLHRKISNKASTKRPKRVRSTQPKKRRRIRNSFSSADPYYSASASSQ